MIRRFLSFLLGARRDGSTVPADFRAGDLASVATDEGGFGVVKILAVDAEGVHIRLHVQRFERRPTFAELPELTTAGFGPGHDNPLSMGHLPLSHRSFAGWEPELLERGLAVEESELEGYRMWEQANGGYF